MARKVSNPSDQDLFCVAAGAIVPALGSIEVSDEAADEVAEHIFVVSDVDEAPEPEQDVEPEQVPEPEAVEAEQEQESF